MSELSELFVAQILSNPKSTGLRLEILINFDCKRLEYRRVVIETYTCHSFIRAIRVPGGSPICVGCDKNVSVCRFIERLGQLLSTETLHRWEEIVRG